MRNSPVHTNGANLNRSFWTEEKYLTLLLGLFSFFALGLPRAFTSTAAHTLFLETYGPQNLPFAYLAEAIVVPLFGHLYIMADERFSTRTLLVGSMMIDVLALVAIWTAFTFFKIKIVAFVGMVWFETEFVFVSLWLWGMATQLMTLRQGKRLFGYISAGEPIAIIIGGAVTPFLLKMLAPQYLMLLSASGVVTGIALVFIITSRFKPQRDAGDDEDEDVTEVAGTAKWYKDRYVQVLVGIVVISQFAYFFTDSAFYLEAGARFPEEVDLGAFIGKTMAAVGVVSLITSLFVSGPLVKRFGLRSALLLLPLMLATTAVTAAILGIGFAAAGLVFWLVVMMKIIDQSVRYTVDKTSSVTLYAPLPAAQRNQVQTALESVIEPVVGGVSGLILAFLVQVLGFGPLAVVGVVIVVTLTWTALVFVQDRFYQKALRTALQARRLGGGSISLSDPAAIAVVTQSLASADVGVVLNGLELVGRIEGFDLRGILQRLLSHKAPEVRRDSLRRIEQLGQGEFAIGPVDDLLRSEGDVTVRAQALRAVAALDPDGVIDRLEPFLGVSDEPVKREAFIALLRHGGIEGILSAGEPLLALMRSEDFIERRFAATVLQGTATSGFNRTLKVLLGDPDPSVRAAALRAVGVGSDAPVLKQAARLMDDDGAGVSRAAANAMEHIGVEAIFPLTDILDDDSVRPFARKMAAKVLGSIKDDRARQVLVGRLGIQDRKIAQAVLFAISTGSGENDEITANALSAAMARLLPLIFQMLTWRVGLTQLPSHIDAVLIRALDWQFDDDLRAVFRLLTLMYPAAQLGDAWRSFQKGDPSQKAIAMEALEVALRNDFRGPILSLIEHDTDVARLDAHPTPAAFPAAPLEKVPSEILGLSAAEVSPWIDASARYTAQHLGIDLARRGPRDSLSTSNDPGERMLTIEKVLVLRNTPIFAAVREEHLVDVAQRAEPVELAKDTVLFQQGDHGSSMFVIVEGHLRIYSGERTFATLGPREVVGEMAAVDPEARSASVAATEHTLLLRISNKNVELLIEHDPDVAMGIIKVLCSRLRASNATKSAPPAPRDDAVLEAAQ